MDRSARAAVLGAFTLALAACAPGSPTTDASQPAAVAHAFTPRLVGEAPLVGHGVVARARYLLVGAVLAHERDVHAWVIAFGDEHIGLRRLTWTDGAQPGDDIAVDGVRVRLPFAIGDPGPLPTSVVQLPDGSWAMYGWAVRENDDDGHVLWRASAATLDGPWMADPGIVLEPGFGPVWDSHLVDFPTVVPDGQGGWLMVYEGSSRDQRNVNRIGTASSTDGVDWQRAANPFLEPGTCSDETEASLRIPRLARDGDGYLVAYAAMPIDRGPASIGIAESPDGASWTCGPNRPLLEPDQLPASGSLHSFGVYRSGDGLMLLAEMLAEDEEASDLWLIALDGPG